MNTGSGRIQTLVGFRRWSDSGFGWINAAAEKGQPEGKKSTDCAAPEDGTASCQVVNSSEQQTEQRPSAHEYRIINGSGKSDGGFGNDFMDILNIEAGGAGTCQKAHTGGQEKQRDTVEYGKQDHSESESTGGDEEQPAEAKLRQQEPV